MEFDVKVEFFVKALAELADELRRLAGGRVCHPAFFLGAVDQVAQLFGRFSGARGDAEGQLADKVSRYPQARSCKTHDFLDVLFILPPEKISRLKVRVEKLDPAAGLESRCHSIQNFRRSSDIGPMSALHPRRHFILFRHAAARRQAARAPPCCTSAPRCRTPHRSVSPPTAAPACG